MKEFLLAALPFIIIGICLAIIFTNKEKINQKNYMLLGMLLGYTIGNALGLSIGHYGITSTTGMLIGLTIGMFIKDENK